MRIPGRTKNIRKAVGISSRVGGVANRIAAMDPAPESSDEVPKASPTPEEPTVARIHALAREFDVSAEAVVYRVAGWLHWKKERTTEAIARVNSSRM